jgi:hypothetical protein
MLREDFFRMQLEVLRPLVDGIVIYEPNEHTASFHEQQGWWKTLGEFMNTLDDAPATFRVTLASPDNANHAPVAAGNSVSAVEDTPVTITATTLPTKMTCR